MNKINTDNWKPFTIEQLFKIETGGDLIYRDIIDGEYPVISHKDQNNGIVCWTQYIENRPLYNHNKTISLADRGNFSAKVQTMDFYIGTRVKALVAKNQNTNIFQLHFLATCINLEKFKFCYGRNATDKLPNIEIKLPIIEKTNDNYEPDWQFMEDYIKNAIELLPKTKNIQKHKFICIDTWIEFKIQNVFDYFEDGKITSTKLLDDGNDIYYCGAKKNQNGIIEKYLYDEQYISKGNCILFICDGQGSIGYNNYMDRDFYATVNLALGYHEKLNKYNAQFLVTILDMERPKFSFGRKRKGTLLETKIKLPAKQNSNGEYEPDWEYMENYIKSLPYADLI